MHRKLRIATVTVALFLSAVGFRLFDLFVDSVLSANNVRWKLDISEKIQIDFYGGVMPTVVSILLVLYLTSALKFSFRRYLYYFPLSIALAFAFFRVSDTAIVGFYFLSILSVGFLAVFISFHKGTLWDLLKIRDLHNLECTRRNYLTALLVATSYASLSVFIVDLAYAPLAISIYIGAMGLTDGIFLSGLLAPIAVTFATLCILFIYEMRRSER